MTASEYIQEMYMWGEREGKSDGMYSKASQIGRQAVSLHNWTSYFYTVLMFWAACWHVLPYFSQILSLIPFHCLYTPPTTSPPPLPSLHLHHKIKKFNLDMVIALMHFFAINCETSSSLRISQQTANFSFLLLSLYVSGFDEAESGGVFFFNKLDFLTSCSMCTFSCRCFKSNPIISIWALLPPLKGSKTNLVCPLCTSDTWVYWGLPQHTSTNCDWWLVIHIWAGAVWVVDLIVSVGFSISNWNV